MQADFYQAVEISPVIAAVKNEKGLECALTSDVEVVFILYGDICSLSSIVEKVKKAGKIAMVHMDLIAGLSAREVAVDFIRNTTAADGIISTKGSLIKRARELSLFTVMRFFVIDSMAIESIQKQNGMAQADFIEVLPGVMPKIIRKICGISGSSVIAGGLIQEKSDVMEALDAGAAAISTTCQEVWFM